MRVVVSGGVGSEDSQHLNSLLTAFGASALGEGDATVGANLLAAMACSIANVHRPGSGLVAPDGSTLAVGTSLIVSGSHTASLVIDKVTSGLGTRQNNLISHIGGMAQENLDNAKKFGAVAPTGLAKFGAQQAGFSLNQLCNASVMDGMNDVSLWQGIVREPAQSGFQYLHDHHVVFATGGKSEVLAHQLGRSHLGRAFLHLGVGGTADFARLDQICPAVMDGRLKAGDMLDVIRGNVFVTDPSAHLGEVLRSGVPSTGWIGRMLWLVDGNAGPEPGDPTAGKAGVALNQVTQRYEEAMHSAWAHRISSRLSAPDSVSVDFTQSQIKWVTFLKGLECDFPGITGTARSLFATLLFGLFKMVAAAPATFRLSALQTLALAKFLVHRMVNARSAVLHSAEDAWKRRQKASIIEKLGCSPQTPRDLSRRFNKLPVDQCREMLFDLEAIGKVEQCDGGWRLRQLVAVGTRGEEQLTLEA